MSMAHPDQLIRSYLQDNPDGLPVCDISSALAIGETTVRYHLRLMPDSYIDRWMLDSRLGRHIAVWCVVVPPEDCPQPIGEID